jgi:hypothetical protein
MRAPALRAAAHPQATFSDIIFGPDLVALLLQHISALLAVEGRSSPNGKEAARIARVSLPLQLGAHEGPAASEGREILATATFGLYERLMETLVPAGSVT